MENTKEKDNDKLEQQKVDELMKQVFDEQMKYHPEIYETPKNN